jgi:hypothetical protein
LEADEMTDKNGVELKVGDAISFMDSYYGLIKSFKKRENGEDFICNILFIDTPNILLFRHEKSC